MGQVTDVNIECLFRELMPNFTSLEQRAKKKQDTSLTLLSVLNKRIEDVRYDLSLDESNFHCSVV